MQTQRILQIAFLVAMSGAAMMPSAGMAAGTETAAPQPLPPLIQSLSGAYLAAKSAQLDGDLKASTTYFGQALDIDPTSEMLQQEAMFAYLAAGQFREGVDLAAKLRDSTDAGKVARIALGVDMLRKGSYGPATAEFDILDTSDLDGLLLAQLSAWADAGDKKVDDALSRIKELDGAEWYPIFNNLQSGLIAGFAGRDDAARGFFGDILADKANAQTSPDAFLAAAEALARLESRAGDKDAALAALDAGLELAANYDPLTFLKAKVEKGEKLDPAIENVNEGAAETLYILGQAINRGDGQQVAILYFQLARVLAPKDQGLLTALAGIAEQIGRAHV